MTGSVRSLGSGPGIAACEIGPVCIVLWRGAVLPATFEIQSQALAQVIARHPGGAGFLCVIEPTAKPPDDELRRKSAEMLTGHGAKLRCVASVVEGSGLKASIARAVLSGITLLARERHTKAEYFANASLAVTWMGEHLAIPPADQVLAALESLRASLPPAA
jgi:hypothetical protein